jgi:hypothetical protein
VRGDESALDMFNWKKGKSAGKDPLFSSQEALSFFIGGASGESVVLFIVTFIHMT